MYEKVITGIILVDKAQVQFEQSFLIGTLLQRTGKLNSLFKFLKNNYEKFLFRLAKSKKIRSDSPLLAFRNYLRLLKHLEETCMSLTIMCSKVCEAR